PVRAAGGRPDQAAARGGEAVRGHAGGRGRGLRRRTAPDVGVAVLAVRAAPQDRKSTRLNSSHLVISYAVFCLKKKKKKNNKIEKKKIQKNTKKNTKKTNYRI